MVLTTDKTKSKSNNCKIDCGGNKSFFTPCKRVGLSRKVGSTTKKITAVTNCSSPCNTIIPASKDTLCKPEKNKINKYNKSLGLTRKSGGKCGLNVSVTSDVTENVTINDFNLNVSTTNVFSSNMTQLCETSTFEKNDSVQLNTDEQNVQDAVFTNTVEETLQELTKKENINCVTVSSFIHNESEKDKKTEIAKYCHIEGAKDKFEKENESSKMCVKKDKIKVAIKSTRKRFSSFFSAKTSSTTSDSDDDFISSLSSSQKSNGSEKSTIRNLLQCSLTIERSDVENNKNKKQQVKGEVVKSMLQKRKKDICSSDEEEFVSMLKKKCSKSIASFSSSYHESLKELNENVHAKEQQIKEKEGTLAELRLVEMYKKLHDVDKLENSIEVWRNGLKEAFADLHSELKVNSPDCSTSALLNKLVIPESVRKSCLFTEV